MMMAFLFAWQQAPGAVEALFPVSIAGWFAFAAAVWYVVDRLSRWGKNTDKWDRAAQALETLSKDVGALLFEIRGVEGRGGLRAEVAAIRQDVDEIKERNGEADLLVEIYKSDLRGRKERGEPIRRDVDRVLDKLTPET